MNGGLGNSDVGNMPLSALDLDNGWLDFPRPKTGIDRRIPLWPETIDGLQKWLTNRPKSRGNTADGLVFVTHVGGPWSKMVSDNPVCHETAKLLKKVAEYKCIEEQRSMRTVEEESEEEKGSLIENLGKGLLEQFKKVEDFFRGLFR